MSSSSQAMKDRFQAQFKPPPAQNLERVEENVHNADPFVTRKHRCTITDSEKKSIHDFISILSRENHKKKICTTVVFRIILPYSFTINYF